MVFYALSFFILPPYKRLSEREIVNENVFSIKGKVHCFVAPLDGKERLLKSDKITIRFRFSRPRRKTK